eukprot:TRINITY_DN38433_c0_g1_i1.p1 TRINITY_DN38433_c0_g1~~TRINITY_DN38433_c0_g1_i1.p1  ORF type:complete len:141 (-),score=25.16 TRINITY_DN38433_c0_g1_i1:418-840(-)
MVGEADGMVIAVPRTYMNQSGTAVARMISKFKPSRVLILHDELNLRAGAWKYSTGGSAHGHGGLKSIMAAVGGSDFGGGDFERVGIGVGKPTANVSDFVVAAHREADRQAVEAAMEEVCCLVARQIEEGLETRLDVAAPG